MTDHEPVLKLHIANLASLPPEEIERIVIDAIFRQMTEGIE
jgi:hypothetical protein